MRLPSPLQHRRGGGREAYVAGIYRCVRVVGAQLRVAWYSGMDGLTTAAGLFGPQCSPVESAVIDMNEAVRVYKPRKINPAGNISLSQPLTTLPRKATI